jgi:hypothetical protein
VDRIHIADDTEIAVVLVFRTGRYHGRYLEVSPDLASDLRQIARNAAASLQAKQPSDYDPDAEQLDNHYLVIPNGTLIDDALVEQIRPGADLEQLDDEYFQRTKTKIFCYAIVLGPNDPTRTIFIRKINPLQLNAKPLVGTRVNGVIEKVTTPILAFDNNIDVIITSDRLLALSKDGFGRLFRDDDFVIAHVQTWLTHVFRPGQLPLTQAGMDHFLRRTKTNSLMRRKIETIMRQPYIATFTVDDFRVALAKAEWNPDHYIVDDCVHVNEQNEMDILHLLSEDPYLGIITGRKLMSTSKRART